MAMFCKRFYCDKRGDRFCCADCPDRDSCSNRCLNHPMRCRLWNPYGTKANRRGGKGKLPPLWNKEK